MHDKYSVTLVAIGLVLVVAAMLLIAVAAKARGVVGTSGLRVAPIGLLHGVVGIALVLHVGVVSRGLGLVPILPHATSHARWQTPRASKWHLHRIALHCQ